MKQQADALIRTGLAECGYTYLNMDDGFFGGRDKNGVLQFHKERFPNGIKIFQSSLDTNLATVKKYIGKG